MLIRKVTSLLGKRKTQNKSKKVYSKRELKIGNPYKKPKHKEENQNTETPKKTSH